MKVVDLDILKPESKFVRLGGNDIDVSFLPSGITFKVDALMNQLKNIASTEADLITLAEGGPNAEKAFDISTEICACFCERNFPEMTKEWFFNNCNGAQITAFTGAIKMALIQAYKTGISEPKNAVAVKRKRK